MASAWNTAAAAGPSQHGCQGSQTLRAVLEPLYSLGLGMVQVPEPEAQPAGLQGFILCSLQTLGQLWKLYQTSASDTVARFVCGGRALTG